jgi:pSer/pThr/pTyr-binding forkhead associated (FHA) protein
VGSLVLPGGERVQLGDEPITLGRLDECDVVLNDATVSRRHAEVHRVDDGYEVVDLGSRNGTRVNGRGVVRERLDDGDELSVGAVGLRFESA